MTYPLFTQWLPGDLYLAVLPVGQGSCGYILTPSGHTIIVDCGTDGVWSTEKFHRRLRGAGLLMQMAMSSAGYPRDIASLVISHPHVDHFRDLHTFYGNANALSVASLKRRREHVASALVEARERYAEGRVPESAMRQIALLGQMSDEYSSPAVPLDFGDGFRRKYFEVPEPWLVSNYSTDSQRRFNNGSCVVVIEYQGERIILPGDIETEAWSQLLKQPEFVERASNPSAIVASHHGHCSGWNPDIVRVLGKPCVWMVSTKRADEHCADAYSDASNSHGMITTDGEFVRSPSTKLGHVVEWLKPSGVPSRLAISTIDCARNANQQRMSAIRWQQLVRDSNIEI